MLDKLIYAHVKAGDKVFFSYTFRYMTRMHLYPLQRIMATCSHSHETNRNTTSGSEVKPKMRNMWKRAGWSFLSHTSRAENGTSMVTAGENPPIIIVSYAKLRCTFLVLNLGLWGVKSGCNLLIYRMG